MKIQFDERGFGSADHMIPWEDVIAVGIRTTADGPFGDDFFWQFLLPGRFVELPGSLVDGAFLGVLQQRLPGTDSRKIIAATGSTDERIFRVWHAEDSKRQWSDVTFRSRFVALVGRLGGDDSRADHAFESLRAAWGEKHRRYHDLEHLADCLRELDDTGCASDIAAVAELALWYHDAVYEPGARDNEERSAALLGEHAASTKIPDARARAAATCVRATAHTSGPAPGERAVDLVLDVDLSILGRDVLRFMEFEYAVAEEHARMSPTLYFLARGRFLANLLAAPAIFRTEHLRRRYEERARANLSALLASPRYRIHRWLGGAYRWRA